MKKYSILLEALFLWCFSFSKKTVSPNTAPTNVITFSDFHISRSLSELSAKNPIVEKQKSLSGEVEECASCWIK